MQRDERLEYLRVLSCFCVILGHISNWYMREFPHLPMNSYICALLFNGICRVSVPMFFMISGALLLEKPTDYKKNNKRTLNIFIKTVGWTLIFLFWDFFYLGQRHNIVDLIVNPVRVHFWFLYVLFGIYLTVPFWRKFVEGMSKPLIKYFSITFVAAMAMSFVLMILKLKATYEIPLIGNCCYVGYFIMGYIIRHYAEDIKIKKRICAAVIFVCMMATNLFTLFASLKAESHIETFSNFKSFFVGVAAMAVFYLVIKAKQPKQRRWVTLLSYHSFNIYMLHVFFLDILQENVDVRKFSAWLGFPIFFILMLLLSLGYSMIYEKAKGNSFSVKNDN